MDLGGYALGCLVNLMDGQVHPHASVAHLAVLSLVLAFVWCWSALLVARTPFLMCECAVSFVDTSYACIAFTLSLCIGHDCFCTFTLQTQSLAPRSLSGAGGAGGQGEDFGEVTTQSTRRWQGLCTFTRVVPQVSSQSYPRLCSRFCAIFREQYTSACRR